MKKLLITILAFLICGSAAVFSADEKPAVSEPDFGPYMRELQKTIKGNWTPPRGGESRRVILAFKVGKDGNLISSNVLKSSNSDKVDEAALDALKKSVPFKPLPESFKGKSVDIQFTFDYNAFPSSTKTFRTNNRIILDEQILKSLENGKSKRSYYSYLGNIKSRIENLSFEQYSPNIETTLQFEVTKDGTVQKIKILKSSQNNAFDKDAAKAIKELKMPELPNAIPYDKMIITCIIYSDASSR